MPVLVMLLQLSDSEQQRIEASFEAVENRIKQEGLTLQKLQSEKVGLMDDLLMGRVRSTSLLAALAQGST
jgi:uncharacterized protein YcgL (UPF0745 family)